MARGIRAIGGVAYIGISFGLALVCHRVGRPPFDDEVLTLNAIDGKSYGAIARFYLDGGDVQPPLSFLWFRLLQSLDLSLAVQRALSFALAAAGFAFVLDLVWRRLPRRSLGAELLTLALFLGAPLLYGAGDALRWYPLFTFLTAASLWCVFVAGRPTLTGAVLLGLAADTAYLAVLPALAYAIWRYAVERRLDPVRDLGFWLLTGLVAVPGLVSFFAAHDVLTSQFATSSVMSFGMDIVGLAGGTILGLTQSVLAIPLLLVLAIGLWSAFAAPGRGYGGDIRGFGGLLMAGVFLLAVLGHDKPRSFLFALPWLCAVASLGGAAWRRPLGLAGPAMAASAVVVAFLMLAGPYNDRPFRRAAVVPVDAIVDYVRAQAAHRTLIVSTEPVSGYRLAAGADPATRCVYVRALGGPCRPKAGDDFATVIVIDDGSLARDGETARLVADFAGGRPPLESRRFGLDRDAALKSWLTGMAFTDYLVQVSVYRRD